MNRKKLGDMSVSELQDYILKYEKALEDIKEYIEKTIIVIENDSLAELLSQKEQDILEIINKALGGSDE